MTQRTDRIDELLRQEIGAIITRDIADPRVGFVTITDVETTRDLSHASVSVSVIGTAEERKEALRALAHAMPFIRRELGSRIQMRRIPELHVKADETLERGTRILRLINEIGAGHDPADVPASDESLPTPVARLPHEGDAPEPPPELGIPSPDPALGARSGRPIRRRRNGSMTAGQKRRPAPRRRGGLG
ncbi:MAG: 30S ribosome-binding factor RbfA [Candidatus Limnocylindrales bacterium]